MCQPATSSQHAQSHGPPDQVWTNLEAWTRVKLYQVYTSAELVQLYKQQETGAHLERTQLSRIMAPGVRYFGGSTWPGHKINRSSELVACSLWWSPICAGLQQVGGAEQHWHAAVADGGLKLFLDTHWIDRANRITVLVRKQAMWHSGYVKISGVDWYNNYIILFFAAKQVWLDVYKEFVQIFLSKELGWAGGPMAQEKSKNS